MDDPRIKEIEMYGYPESMLKNHVGEDYFGNELYKGDEVFDYEGDYFLIDEISSDLIAFLELISTPKITL